MTLLNNVADASVDMILADLPYGTTNNKWDSVIPLDQLWSVFRRICKPGAPIVLFTQQPFTTTVAASNLKQLRTEWIWQKPQGTGFLNANRYPLKSHENILVFCDCTPPYTPQKTLGSLPYRATSHTGSGNYRSFDRGSHGNTDGSRFPKTVLEFPPERGLHPTQKPVALLEYLIRTYSRPSDVILDPTMGSGSTGVAAMNTDRAFVGIELDETYFEVASKRIAEANTAADTARLRQAA